MVNIGIDISAGSVFEPNGKTGVASLTANLLNKGAVIQGVKRDEAYLADRISDLGAVFSSNANNELSSFRIKSLSKPEILNEVILLSAGMIANPIYEEKVLARQKTVMISALLDKKADPDYIMSEEFTKRIYQGNPLGKLVSEKEIKSINSVDLKKFHQTYYRAKNTNVIIVGDLDQNNAVQIATELTKQLMRTSPVDLSIPPFVPLPIRPPEERIIRISHPSAQAHIANGD
jgi:zinc protease